MISVKSIIRSHSEWILIAIGVLFAVAICWILIWGVTILAQNLGASLGTPRSQYAAEKFDLEKVSELNFRGLKQQ